MVKFSGGVYIICGRSLGGPVLYTSQGRLLWTDNFTFSCFLSHMKSCVVLLTSYQRGKARLVMERLSVA